MKRGFNRGRKSLIDERGDKILIRTVRKNTKQTLSEIVDNFNQHAPQKFSVRTNVLTDNFTTGDSMLMESTDTK